MIIKNTDALKSWLIIILEPLCDADSSALARYVLALLKKERPAKELRRIMVEQLDVFLGNQTVPFIERLFSTLMSEDYLEPNLKDIHLPLIKKDVRLKNDVSKIDISKLGKMERDCTTPPLIDTKTKDLLLKLEELSSQTPPPEISATTSIPVIVGATTTIVPIKSGSPLRAIISDKENQPRESRRRLPTIKSRSRSRSNDRSSRRSRSRERRPSERDRTKQFRNKSPPMDRSDRGIDRRRQNDRRHGVTGNAGGHERNVENRSPRNFANSKLRTKSRSPSPSRSPSMERQQRLGSTPPSSGKDKNRQRCRDFDEKGYCVRGETCPWDHGINPVVLESLNNPPMNLAHLREYNPGEPGLWTRGSNGAFAGPHSAFPHKPVTGGGQPGVFPRPGVGAGIFRPNGPMFPFPGNAGIPPLQRELVPVPVVIDANSNIGGDISANQSKRRFELEDTVAVAEGPQKRKPLNSRLGPRVANTQNNCSLELRKIPRGMNSITHLNNHFVKFGKIVNIQISYDGDPEAAIITFSTHAEANVAYRSTEAVLNNRFIKVFWHTNSESNNNGPSTLINKDEPVINGSGVRKSSQYHLNNVPAVPVPVADAAKTTGAQTPSAGGAVVNGTTPVTSSTNIVTPNTARLKTNNRPSPPTGVSNAIIRKKQEEQAKAVVHLAHGLHKRKHELLHGYLKQMKSAVELVERCDANDPQRANTLETIKILQETIDKLRKEINTEQAQISAQIKNQPSAKKSKEEQKKELLDIELELFAQQQEGNDTTAIQKRLEELQRSVGVVTKSHFLGNRPIRPLRPSLPVSTSVDRRPKGLIITGFDSEDCDGLLEHFKHFGEITKHEVDRTLPQLIISYATRGNAEQAVLRGKVFKDNQLQISWAPTNPIPSQIKQQLSTDVTNPITEKITGAKTNDMDTNDSLPELRLEDEEEDEEAENRSWRR